MNKSEIALAVEGCEFFKGLEKDHIKRIAGLCRVEKYKNGEYIFRQGDFGENLYIVVQGHVFLERGMDMGEKKGRAVIGVLGRGRVLGCWSTLLGEPHNLMSSAVCQKPTVVLALNGAELREIMLSSAELGFNVLERLCFLLRDRIQGAYGAMEKI
jgi:CRP/FNR family transcriptional regulator, cyclic AMP receptor protein